MKCKSGDGAPAKGGASSSSSSAAPAAAKYPSDFAAAYDMKEQIGTGGMSIVKKGIRKADDKVCALKFIEKTIVEDINILQREIDLMKKLKHKNILELYEVFENDKQFILVTEYVSGGELFDKIVQAGNYSERDAALIIKQVLEGVEYMHDKKVSHRDLKPENLLCAGGEGKEIGVIKIADFGLAKSFEGSSGGGNAGALTTSCGTPDYVAPEVLRASPYDQCVDLWSVGVITYILLCGFPPFWGEQQGELFDKILTVKYNFPDPEWSEVSNKAKDFINKLLVDKPSDRMTATQALQHPWIVEFTAQDFSRTLNRMNTTTQLQNYNEKRKNGELAK